MEHLPLLLISAGITSAMIGVILLIVGIQSL
jgi:hypothetical protein